MKTFLNICVIVKIVKLLKMGNITGNLFKIIGGIILLVFTLWIGIMAGSWGRAALDVVKGGILLMIVFIGLILIFVGLSDLKSS